MSADLLASFERDLCKVGEEIWNIDGPDDVLDEMLKKISLLKVQLEIQKSLQATANLLRRQPSDKALPKQQATKVKHFIRFVFRKESRGQGRHRQLRNLDCDALKFCGLSYTAEDIVKLGDAEFEILQKRIEQFIHHRNLSHLLYRPDVDKAVNAKFEDPEDDESFEKFIQSHTTLRLKMRKRKHDEVEMSVALANNQVVVCDKAGPSQAPIKEKMNTNVTKDDHETEPSQASPKSKTNTYDGDLFIVDIVDARQALCHAEQVWEIWLTNPESKYNANHVKKRSFLTLWISEALGKELGKRSKPMVVNVTSDEQVKTPNSENADACLHEQSTRLI